MSTSRVLLAIVVALTLGLGIYAAIRIHQVQEAPVSAHGGSDAMLPTAYSSSNIYPDASRAPADLSQALERAAKENKRVILDFGGDWCPDCRVLDIYFHNSTNLPILQKNFVLVHINVGRLDENVDLAARYGIPLRKGVPALAVLAQDGRLLYSQSDGQFEAMRNMDPASVTKFLEQWKP